MKVSLKMEGGPQLARALGQLPTRVSKSMLRGALASVVAPPIQQRASALAPRAPGAPDLASHIAIATGTSRGESAAVVVGPSAEGRSDQPARTYGLQGMFVEFGTNDTAAQPFLRPAFEQEAPRTLGEFASAVWAALARGGVSSRGSSSGGGLL